MVPNRKGSGFAKDGPHHREDLPTTLARVEREIIIGALRASCGNKARAARALGISERLMGLRVKKYEINTREFRRIGRIVVEKDTG